MPRMTKWTKPISRQITLPNGEMRIVTLTETGVQIRVPKKVNPSGIVPYADLEGYTAEKALLVHTQHWGPLRASLLPHGVSYSELGRGKLKDVLCPHGTAFQRGLDIQIAQERREKQVVRKARRR